MELSRIKPLCGILTITILLAAGCKSDRKVRRAPGLIDEEETAAIVDRIETIKNVYHLCPSPAEMLSVIDLSGLSFDGALLNDPGKRENYMDTKSRTLNLGVYITDMAYAALFGRHEETLDYLDMARAMAGEIRLTGAIGEELIENARENVEYLDSLFMISNEAFMNMLFFCEKNDRPNTIIMLSTGAFIESMYLAINLVEDFDNAGQILQHLAEQKYALDNLMAFAESMKEDDDNIASLMEDMKPVKAIYDRIETEAGSTMIRKEASNKLVIGGGGMPALDREEFEALKDVAFQLREQITGI